MNNRLKTDAVISTFLVLTTSSFPWFVKDTFLDNPLFWSAIVVLPLAFYLGYRKKKNWTKIIVGSLVFGAMLGILLEYFAHITFAWQVPSTIFPFRILGATTIEAVIGYIFMTAFVLVFYEHFFDKDVTHKISNKIWHAVIPISLVIILVVALHYISPEKLRFGNSYMKMGLAAIVPLFWQISRFPALLRKYAVFSLSLFFFFFVFEIVGVTFNYWIFPGEEYIGTISVAGRSFPLEEIIFWMLLYPPTIAAYYEHFIDDER